MSQKISIYSLLFIHQSNGITLQRQKKPPTEACGVRTKGKGNDEEPRIGCFPIPQLCLDDYTLRYANAFPDELERAKEQAKVEGRVSLSDEKGSEEQSEANSPSHAIDTNRLSKSRGKIEPNQENAVDNEPTVPLSITTTTTTTTANPLPDKELESNEFTPLFTSSTVTTKRETEPNFQDITNFESPLTTALSEQSKTFEMTPEPLITTTQLVHPTLLNTEPETLSTEPQITLTTQMHIFTTTTVPTQVDKGESEFLPEELEEDVREILTQKRREGHHFFGTTTVPTTTTTIPTTTTPRVCKDKHKVTPYICSTDDHGIGKRFFSCAASGL
ncbi:hypothetical protein ANCDUO_02142 [Ancylostoma duodenale]|uniref:Uncharacterized protein n=1 Tax=Ancylostoma duodenale TaxID=51022 RepID=A0A0C2H7I7_9BILA|nr:hypothetical protein ANCDUO_02142 [Ancylostoma duodenale]